MINTINIVPRYAETDKMGIVHHSVYAIWYELARTEYFNKIGLRYDEIEESGIITPLVELNCKYKLPAYYNQEVSVETKLIKLTPAKFILQYDVYDKGGKHLNVGTTTLAWADAGTFKILNLKRSYPALYSKLLQLLEE